MIPNMKNIVLDTLEVAIIYLSFCLILTKILYLVDVSFKRANRFHEKYKNTMNAIRNKDFFIEELSENAEEEEEEDDDEDEDEDNNKWVSDSEYESDLDINSEVDSENENTNVDEPEEGDEEEEDTKDVNEDLSNNIDDRFSEIDKYNRELSEQLCFIETKISNQDNVFIKINEDLYQLIRENKVNSQKFIALENRVSRMYTEVLDKMYSILENKNT